MRRLATIATALAVVALLAACGSDDNEETSSTTIAPGGGVSGADSTNATVPLPKPACEFLSQDEVATLLGNAVTAPTQGAQTNCTWGTTVDGGSSLDLTVVKPSATGGAQACSDQRRTLPSGLPRESVDGIGDSGVWVLEQLTTIKQGHLLACWDDGVVVVLLTGERESSAMQDTAKAVAEQAHERI